MKQKELPSIDNDIIASRWASWAVLWTTASTAGWVYWILENVTSFWWLSWASNMWMLIWAGKGLVWGWLASLVSGLILKSKSKTEEWKALWKWLSIWGSLGSAVGFAALYPALWPLMSIFWWSLSLLILYWLISWNKEELEEVIKKEKIKV